MNNIGNEECTQGVAANQPGLQMNDEKIDANNITVCLIESSEISLQNVQVAAEISVLSEFDNSFNETSLEQPLTPPNSEINLQNVQVAGEMSVLSEFDK